MKNFKKFFNVQSCENFSLSPFAENIEACKCGSNRKSVTSHNSQRKGIKAIFQTLSKTRTILSKGLLLLIDRLKKQVYNFFHAFFYEKNMKDFFFIKRKTDEKNKTLMSFFCFISNLDRKNVTSISEKRLCSLCWRQESHRRKVFGLTFPGR